MNKQKNVKVTEDTAMTDNNLKNTTVNAETEVLQNSEDKIKTQQSDNKSMDNTETTETTNVTESAQEQKTPELSKEEFEALMTKASKADEYYERLLRVSADFDNYKKQMARERQDTIKFANESLVLRLLPVLDNFEIALNSQNLNNASIDSFRTGVNMIYTQLKNALSEIGLEEINAINQQFDPRLHEAVAEKETSEIPAGVVVEQIRKGYKLNSKLIRPAMVIVSKAPSEKSQNKDTNK